MSLYARVTVNIARKVTDVILHTPMRHSSQMLTLEATAGIRSFISYLSSVKATVEIFKNDSYQSDKYLLK